MTNKESHHIVVPLKYYVGTLLSLLFLTFITVLVSRIDFGSWNTAVALMIALLKAFLVANYFMGLKWDKGFNKLFFIGGLMALSLFFAFTLLDLKTRGDITPEEKGNHDLTNLVKPISESKKH
jgi:cytochrome c oxidase subunit 4